MKKILSLFLFSAILFPYTAQAVGISAKFELSNEDAFGEVELKASTEEFDPVTVTLIAHLSDEYEMKFDMDDYTGEEPACRLGENPFVTCDFLVRGFVPYCELATEPLANCPIDNIKMRMESRRVEFSWNIDDGSGRFGLSPESGTAASFRLDSPIDLARVTLW